MSHKRIFWDKTPLDIHQPLTIDSTVSHRLLNVLRLQCGDECILFDGSGYDYLATIQQIHKKQLILNIQQKIAIHNQSILNIHLGQSLTKNEKVDFIIQKAVELGVHDITLFNTQHTSQQLSTKQLQQRRLHWQKILQHSCEQCGRSILPKLTTNHSMNDWLLKAQSSETQCILLDPRATQSLMQTLQYNCHTLFLLVGPEGGFANDEMTNARAMNFKTAHLGSRILRADTAALAAIAAIQGVMGDFKAV